jgi:6-phosphogluconolactonase
MMAPVRSQKAGKHGPSGAIAATHSVCALALVACTLGPIAARQPQAAGPAGSDALVYLGTYTGKESKGIYVSRLEMATGRLSPPQLAAETPSPSYLAIHATKRFLYAANEVSTFGGKDTGSVSAFAIDRTSGLLTPLNQQPSVGRGPVYVVVDATGRNLLVANYGGGSVAVLPLAADGTLRPASAFVQHTGSGPDPKRQTAPRAHSINLDPGNRFAYAADLGIDKVLIYRFDADRGTLVANDPPFAAVRPAAGPRHFAFHPSGRFAYVINELNMTLTAFAANAERGGLTEIETVSTLPPGEAVKEGFSTADVQVHPSGRFLFGSNRGRDSIVVFAIDNKTGTLTYVENESTQGSTPRGFGIDPSGRYLLAANQRSDSVVVFRIDQKTGRLEPAGNTIRVPSPVCVKFVAP